MCVCVCVCCSPLLLKNMGKCTWLYILSSSCEEFFYVGMSYRLITRLQEHSEGRGALATQKWCYNTLQAVYKIDSERCHNQELEDQLTLKLMKGQGGAWWKVRGGRWHQTSKIEKPLALVDMKQFPETCMCHYPVAEKVSKDGRPYVSCARKDIDWLKDTRASEFIGFADGDCDYFRWNDE